MGTVKLAPSPFEQFASDHGYNIAPAALPAENRVYADSRTQAAYEAWLDGARYVACMHLDSTFNTKAFREKLRELMGNA